jgi:hypothetical protein
MCLSLMGDDRLWNIFFDTWSNNADDIFCLGFHRFSETMFLGLCFDYFIKFR